MEVRVHPARCLKGEVKVPGDKSLTHRAFLLGALAQGETKITGFLESADCQRTRDCLKALGIEVSSSKEKIVVKGQGLFGFQEPSQVLDTGNSATTMRLLLGILAGQKFYSVLAGDASLNKRPMGRVTAPLREMGARIYGRQGGAYAPLTVLGGELKPLTFYSPVASAQVKSAVLLAGLLAEGETTVVEPALSRDHTERMLKTFGAQVTREGLEVKVAGRPCLRGQKIEIPGDLSAAAFFLVAGLIVPSAEVYLPGVGANPTRTGIVEILQQMGGKIEVSNLREVSGEPVADLYVKSSRLRGTIVEGTLIPRLLDEIPVLAVAAVAAEGVTIIKDATELRVKETDRLATIASELQKLGAQVTEQPDGLVIQGGVPLKGGICRSHGDHRLAMALAVAGLIGREETIVQDAEWVEVSFPHFFEALFALEAGEARC